MRIRNNTVHRWADWMAQPLGPTPPARARVSARPAPLSAWTATADFLVGNRPSPAMAAALDPVDPAIMAFFDHWSETEATVAARLSQPDLTYSSGSDTGGGGGGGAGVAEDEGNYEDRAYYRAHRDMTTKEREFMDYVFYLVNIAITFGIFDDYWADQTLPAAAQPSWSVWNALPAIGLLTDGWQVPYDTYVSRFDGTKKVKVKVVDGLATIGVGVSVFGFWVGWLVEPAAVYGMGWKGRIEINKFYFDCAMDRFNGKSWDADAAETRDVDSARRVCAALDVAAVVVHEMVHHAGDWREAPAYSLEGWFRTRLWELLNVTASGEGPGNFLASLLALAWPGLQLPESWRVSECSTTIWTCGTTWQEGSGDCGLGEVRNSVKNMPSQTNQCWPKL